MNDMRDLQFLESRLRNQLRIHWKLLQKKDHKGLTDFIMAVIRNNDVKIPNRYTYKDEITTLNPETETICATLGKQLEDGKD